MRTTDLVFVDTETTGLEPLKNEIIEIALVRVRQEWTPEGQPAFVFVEDWSAKIKPQDLANANPASLRVNGYTPDQWAGAIPAADAMRIFSEKTDGAIMVAHNVAFDAEFIDKAFSDHCLVNKMHYHRIDTVSMAYAKLHGATDLMRYSLGELCKHFAIVNERPHSALSDAYACFELFKKLM